MMEFSYILKTSKRVEEQLEELSKKMFLFEAVSEVIAVEGSYFAKLIEMRLKGELPHQLPARCFINLLKEDRGVLPKLNILYERGCVTRISNIFQPDSETIQFVFEFDPRLQMADYMELMDKSKEG